MTEYLKATIEQDGEVIEESGLEIDCQAPESNDDPRCIQASARTPLEDFLYRVGLQFEEIVKREAAAFPHGIEIRIAGTGRYRVGRQPSDRGLRLAHRYLKAKRRSKT